MKKTLAILLVLVMALCLFAGCQTNEPDDGMIEVAIRALSLVIPEQEGTDQW